MVRPASRSRMRFDPLSHATAATIAALAADASEGTDRVRGNESRLESTDDDDGGGSREGRGAAARG